MNIATVPVRFDHVFVRSQNPEVETTACQHCGIVSDGDQLAIDGECLIRLRQHIHSLQSIIAGQVDPIFASSLRENIRSQLVGQLSEIIVKLEVQLLCEQTQAEESLTEGRNRGLWEIVNLCEKYTADELPYPIHWVDFGMHVLRMIPKEWKPPELKKEGTS